jgi:hypothetical protein
MTKPSGKAPAGQRSSPAATEVTTARPATDPDLPARLRRRLCRYRTAEYSGDPAAVPPARRPPNRHARVYQMLRPEVLGAPISRTPKYPPAKDMPYLIYLWAVIAVCITLFTARQVLAAICLLAVTMAVPAIPGGLAAWTCWRYEGRYIEHGSLDARGRRLLLRAQAAVDAAGSCYAVQRGATEDPRPGLAWHEWEIASTLHSISRSAHGADSPEGAAALAAVTEHVRALEHYTETLDRASAALRERDQDLAAGAAADDLRVDLSAGVAGHEHRIAELTDLSACADTLAEALVDE